jgi:predicted O-methyltransferase YrrM
MLRTVLALAAISFVLTVLAILAVLLRKVTRVDREVWGVGTTLRRMEENGYRQVEAAIGLYAEVAGLPSLPPLRGWAGSPDFLVRVAREIASRRPTTVVECGSGSSTIVTAMMLQRLGAGHVWSLDHSAEFAQKTRDALAARGLSGFATVLHAPLVGMPVPGGEQPWYDAADLAVLTHIDMIVVDGPPEKTAPLARYPVLPVLRDRLAAGCVILLDDAGRPDEKAVVARWLAECPDFVAEDVLTEKGLVILRRTADQRRD